MQMTIIGTDVKTSKKQMIHFVLLIAAISVAVIALNVLLSVFRTDATHSAFAAINIIADIAALWGIYGVLTIKILPGRKRIKLYERGERSGKEQTGTFKEISGTTLCVQGFQCYKAAFGTDDATVELYLIADGIHLEVGKEYKLFSVENLIYKAEEAA